MRPVECGLGLGLHDLAQGFQYGEQPMPARPAYGRGHGQRRNRAQAAQRTTLRTSFSMLSPCTSTENTTTM
jgi:hypothetical protein